MIMTQLEVHGILSVFNRKGLEQKSVFKVWCVMVD